MRRAVVPVVAALCFAAACGGKGKKEQPKKGARPFPVETQTIAARDVHYTFSAVGSVVAFEEVQVTARVAGVVEKVSFVEGQIVTADQSLVEIEPRRFELAVRAAKANLDKAEAARGEARSGVARREKVDKTNPGLIPGEEVGTWRTRSRTAAAEVATARVALERAELDQRDAHVRAPVAGELQTRVVKTGQYVQPGTVLATMQRRDPLLLRFDLPVREAEVVKPGARVTFTAGGTSVPYQARVVFVAAAADETTRMVDITAEVYDFRKAELRPGTFARVTVELGESRSAVVIPQIAVRPSEKGFLAFVVDGGKAQERVVELGMRTADGMVEVRSGLKIGETLAVRGAEALRTGAPVITAGAKGGKGDGQKGKGGKGGTKEAAAQSKKEQP